LGKGGSIDLRTEPVVITIRRSEPTRNDVQRVRRSA
jgi:hypothetical protein